MKDIGSCGQMIAMTANGDSLQYCTADVPYNSANFFTTNFLNSCNDGCILRLQPLRVVCGPCGKASNNLDAEIFQISYATYLSFKKTACTSNSGCLSRSCNTVGFQIKGDATACASAPEVERHTRCHQQPIGLPRERPAFIEHTSRHPFPHGCRIWWMRHSQHSTRGQWRSDGTARSVKM